MRSDAIRALAQRVMATEIRPSPRGIPRRPFGPSGELLSIIGLGGWHSAAHVALNRHDPSHAIRLMHAAIDEGINFFDNAWCYHDGLAEELMGRALAEDRKRERVFLMTKNCERGYAGSVRCLDDSLRRLQTDYLDLWMFHECNWDNDPEWIFERGGLAAAEEALAQGKVRHVGFTGHKDPRIHGEMLRRRSGWSASLMPINLLDAGFRSFLHQVVPVCQEAGTAVLGIKAFGGGWPGGRILERTSLTARDLLHFSLSQPIVSQIVGIGDMAQLREAVAVARGFAAMPEERQTELIRLVKDVAGDGRYEAFKTTTEFEGPHHMKQHGFSAGDQALGEQA